MSSNRQYVAHFCYEQESGLLRLYQRMGWAKTQQMTVAFPPHACITYVTHLPKMAAHNTFDVVSQQAQDGYEFKVDITSRGHRLQQRTVIGKILPSDSSADHSVIVLRAYPAHHYVGLMLMLVISAGVFSASLFGLSEAASALMAQKLLTTLLSLAVCVPLLIALVVFIRNRTLHLITDDLVTSPSQTPQAVSTALS